MMMPRIFAGLMMCVALLLAMPAVAHPPEKHAVEAAMTESAAGWNAGDVNRFMAVYSDAPDTSFVTSEGLLRGKVAMTARYKARYAFDNAAKRGTLTFKTLDFRLLDPQHALYIAQYTLTYADGKTQSGPTTLIFRKEGGNWRIIADHSS